MQEAQIGRLWFKVNQAKRKSYQDPIPKNKLDIVVHTCEPSYAEAEVRRSQSEDGLDKTTRSYLKNKLKAKRLDVGGAC
jgi:hypothetical protein